MERRIRHGKRVYSVKVPILAGKGIATGRLANSIGADIQRIL
jgi:hypothetical protein